jgi:hypothetical protein
MHPDKHYEISQQKEREAPHGLNAAAEVNGPDY